MLPSLCSARMIVVGYCVESWWEVASLFRAKGDVFLLPVSICLLLNGDDNISTAKGFKT